MSPTASRGSAAIYVHVVRVAHAHRVLLIVVEDQVPPAPSSSLAGLTKPWPTSGAGAEVVRMPLRARCWRARSDPVGDEMLAQAGRVEHGACGGRAVQMVLLGRAPEQARLRRERELPRGRLPRVG